MSSCGFYSARAAQPRSCTPTTKVGSVDILLETSYDKLGTGAASATSDEVEHKITITNNGLLRLYDIGVEDAGLQARGARISCTDVDLQTATGAGHGVFAGLAAYPGNGLAPAASLMCSARDGVTQAEVGQSAVRVVSMYIWECASTTTCTLCGHQTSLLATYMQLQMMPYHLSIDVIVRS